MATVEEKISAVSKLMQDGILTAEEFASIAKLLTGGLAADEKPEKSPIEVKYEDTMKNKVAYAFRSPSGIKFPPLQSSMIKEKKLKIIEGWSTKERQVRYIETYVDAPNAYGTMLRQKIAIVVDENFDAQMVITPVKGLLGGETDTWSTLAGVKL